MNTTNDGRTHSPKEGATPAERSRRYPAISLSKTVEFLKSVKEKIGNREISRSMLANVFGVKPSSGDFSTKLAALAHFGLIEKGTGGIKISSRGIRILSPLNEEERKGALLEAFREPSLYKEIIAKWGGIALPPNFERVLHRNYGITEEAAPRACEAFMKSAAYAEAIGSDGVLNLAQRASAHEDLFTSGSRQSINLQSEFEQAESFTEGAPIEMGESRPSSDYQVFDLALTSGRKAKLVIPNELESDDIELIEAQVKVVKLQVQQRERRKEASPTKARDMGSQEQIPET